MAKSERRTPEQVRGEITAERERLTAAIGVLEAEAKRAGRIGSYVLGAVAGAVALRRLARGRRRSKA